MKKINLQLTILFFFLFKFNFLYAVPIIIPEAKLKTKIQSHLTDTVIPAETFKKTEIQKSPTINLNQFLKQEQSIARLTNNSADSSQVIISIRGFGDNAVANSLILVDGFPLINPSLLAPNLSTIPLNNIDHFEIVQGSMGSLWGNQAVGGVINIITKHPEKFSLNSILSIGNFATNVINFSLSDKKDNGIFYKIFIMGDKTDHYRQHNDQQEANINLQIGTDYSRGRLSANLQFFNNLIYFPGGLSEEQFRQNPRQATDFSNYNRSRSYLFQLWNKHELNAEWFLDTRLNHHITHLFGSKFNSHSTDSLISVNPILSGSITNTKLLLGILTQKSKYAITNDRVHSNADAQENDLYVRAIYPATDNINLTFGARNAWQNNGINTLTNHTQVKQNVLVTEQGLSWQPLKEIILFVRRDGNFSFPKANEQTWIPSTLPLLKIQTGTSYETGLRWQVEKYVAQLNLYVLQLNHEIAFNPQTSSEQPYGSFANLDKTIRHGLSLSQKYEVNSRWKLNAQIDYVDAKFAAGPYKGKTIPAVPSLNSNAGLDYAITENWHTQYNIHYTSSRYASEDLANSAKKIPAYFLQDVSLQYLLKSYSFNFEIQNLFNVNYVNYAYYNTFAKQIMYYPAAGRSYLLTVKIDI